MFSRTTWCSTFAAVIPAVTRSCRSFYSSLLHRVVSWEALTRAKTGCRLAWSSNNYGRGPRAVQPAMSDTSAGAVVRSGGRRRRPRGLVGITLAIVTAAAVAGVAWTFARDDDSATRQGPLVHAGDGGFGTVFTEPLGSIVTQGSAPIVNRGPAVVVINDVRVISGDGDLEYVGALVAGPQREIDVLSDHGFPPVSAAKFGDLEHAEGYRLRPSGARGHILLVGLKISSPERASLRDIVVDYTVDHERFSLPLHIAVTSCPPPLEEESCATEYGDAESG